MGSWRWEGGSHLLGLALLALVLFAEGCDASAPSATLEGSRIPIVCKPFPLSQYCSSPAQCPDYEVAVASTRQVNRSLPLCSAAIGRCGVFRFTKTSGLYGGTTLFFDDTNRVIAVATWTDALRLGDPCGPNRYYGAVLECSLDVVEQPCGAR